MSLVVDTSVIIAVITNESHKKELIELTKGEKLIAPYSLHWEIANAFSSMFKRKLISLQKAKKLLELYKKIEIRFVNVDLERALEISSKNNIYAYDAYFLVVAEHYNLKLITLDKALISVAKLINIDVVEVK